MSAAMPANGFRATSTASSSAWVTNACTVWRAPLGDLADVVPEARTDANRELDRVAVLRPLVGLVLGREVQRRADALDLAVEVRSELASCHALKLALAQIC